VRMLVRDPVVETFHGRRKHVVQTLHRGINKVQYILGRVDDRKSLRVNA
jgi:hypothetical protein